MVGLDDDPTRTMLSVEALEQRRKVDVAGSQFGPHPVGARLAVVEFFQPDLIEYRLPRILEVNGAYPREVTRDHRDRIFAPAYRRCPGSGPNRTREASVVSIRRSISWGAST